MPTTRDFGGVIGSTNRSSRRQQQQRSSRHAAVSSSATTKGSSTKMMISSPDKTEASTPPSSPELANDYDSSNNYHHTGKKQDGDWGVGPDDEEEEIDDLHQQNPILQENRQQPQQQPQQPQQQPESYINNGNGLHGKFLSVDKILCRAPSHDSNISDLSASLSPHPTFASGGNNRWGEILRRGKSLESGTESEAGRGGINHNERAEGGNNNENIVLKVLNECGVLDNVNDLFRLTNNQHHHNGYADDEDDEDIPPPPPPAARATVPLPPPPLPQQLQQKKKSGGFCNEKPAVWGVAPDDDYVIEDAEDDMNIMKNVKDASTRTKSLATTKEKEAAAAAAEEEEYDIVELVLDEAQLRGTSSSTSSRKGVSTKNTESATTTAAVGVTPSPAKRISGTSAAGGGGKSPVVIKGILKNKLSSMKLSSNKTSPTTSTDASSPPRPVVAMSGTIGGMAVVDASGKSISGETSREGGEGGPVVAATSVSSPVSTQVDKPSSSATPQKLHSRSILTASQQKKLANVVKKSSSSSSTGGSVVGNDPPGIIAENGLAEQSPKPDRALTALDKVDRAMIVALTTSGSDDVRNNSNSPYGDVEINDKFMVKDRNDDEAEVNDKKKTNRMKKKMLGGFSFHKSKSSSTPESKKDPPTSSSSMNTEDDKSYNADAAATAASNTRSNSSSSLFRSRSKNKGLEAEADPVSNVTLTPQAIEDAKKWKEIFDTRSKKYYYYHQMTKEVRWEKPLGYDEAFASKVTEAEESSPRRNSVGFMGRGKNSGASARGKKKTTPSDSNRNSGVNKKDGLNDRTKKENERGNVNLSEEAKYWRATLDSTTNKTYYYNKKTKEVTWKKPACIVDNEGEDGDVGMMGSKKVVETTSMASVAKNRKKSWFKRGGGSNNDNKNDDIKLNEDGAKANDTSNKDEILSENADDAVNDTSKYWRSALDASTGKTYYFNKKTQLVSWIKPEGFVEKESSKNKKKERDASSEVVAAAVDTELEKVEETAVKVDEIEQAMEPLDAGENQTTVSQHTTDNFSEMEGFTDAEAIDNQVNETIQLVKEDAPFDEPFDCVQSSPRRAHFEPKVVPKPEINEEDDDEQHDTFIENDNFATGDSLSRRAKSLKSTISIDRQRTFASQTTETTRKAANTHNHLSSSRINRVMSGTTHEESLNNSSIASEIFFADEEPVNNHQIKGHDHTEVRPMKNAPAPLSSRITQSIRNMSHHKEGNNRRYPGKRAENLGDSSIESIEEEDELDDRYLNVDDDVSALSGIGNDTTGNKKDKRGQREKEESSARHRATQKKSRSDNVKDWTQEELDLFISKNDWGSVAEYINEMRLNKEAGGSRRSNHNAQTQPSGCEIQDRTDYRRSLDGEIPRPKLSQNEPDEISQDSHSAAESESVWQSLSSASYESDSSQFRRTTAHSKRSSR